jgi:hypothetical protein
MEEVLSTTVPKRSHMQTKSHPNDEIVETIEYLRENKGGAGTILNSIGSSTAQMSLASLNWAHN